MAKDNAWLHADIDAMRKSGERIGIVNRMRLE